jgi:hypothetical protein
MNFLDEYMEEARTKIKEEIENLIPKKEKELLISIKKYNIVMNKMPYTFLKRILTKVFYSDMIKKKQLDFSYPPLIYFDRVKQEFKINR